MPNINVNSDIITVIKVDFIFEVKYSPNDIIIGVGERLFNPVCRGIVSFETSLIPNDAKISDVSFEIEVIHPYQINKSVDIVNIDEYLIEKIQQEKVNSKIDSEKFFKMIEEQRSNGNLISNITTPFLSTGIKTLNINSCSKDLEENLKTDLFALGFICSDENSESENYLEMCNSKLIVKYSLPDKSQHLIKIE